MFCWKTVTLTPNDVSSARWQRLYAGHFGITFLQWEEVETCHPSHLESVVQTQTTDGQQEGQFGLSVKL